MRSMESMVDAIFDEGLNADSVHCIDRCTTSELIEVQQELSLLLDRPTNEKKVIDFEMMGKNIPSEVHNRASRLHFLNPDHPILAYYYRQASDRDENGELIPAKVQARLEDMLDIYWDWTLGDRHEQDPEVVITKVWENYLAAISKFAPHTFLSTRADAAMKLERFLFNAEMQEYD